MSSIANPQSEPPINEELVAYLDGELPPEDCRRVEDRLAADDGYRQQLRDLDQAWEALSALPPTTVDDGFARTTIELACVAAEEDLSQRTARASAETRRRSRWWIAAGVVSAVMGFILMRALEAHRNNMLLVDLPVIVQGNVLAHAPSVDFLRQLSSTDFAKELVKNEPAFNRDLADFTKANAVSLDERRKWVDALTAEQKANLAERARAYEELRQKSDEKERLRTLTNDIGRATDAAALQTTLIAYGQWLSRQHNAAEKEQLDEEIAGLPAKDQVEVVGKMLRREDGQSARHLPVQDIKIFLSEILKLADQQKAVLLERMPPGRERELIAKQNTESMRPALFVLHTALMRNEENWDAAIDGLVSKLSADANAQWSKVSRWRRDLRRQQLWQWVRDALQPKWTAEDLERFFAASDKLTAEERQRLLDMPRPKMEAALEKLYLSSELGIDDKLQFLREFGDGGRGSRNGPGPEGGRPGAGPPGRRGDGPPPEPRFGPEGPPGERFDRNRPPGGPGGRRGPQEDRRDGGRPGDRSRRLPGDGPPPPNENREPI